MGIQEDFKGVEGYSKKVFKVDLEGDSKGDFRGDFKQDLEGDSLSSSGQVFFRSGSVYSSNSNLSL